MAVGKVGVRCDSQRSIAPWKDCCQKEGTRRKTRVLLNTLNNSAPRTAPTTVPTPPVMATPPTTVDVITVSSIPSAAVASTVPKRASQSAPANPAMAPEMINPVASRRLTLMPARTAAFGLLPIA